MVSRLIVHLDGVQRRDKHLLLILEPYQFMFKGSSSKIVQNIVPSCHDMQTCLIEEFDSAESFLFMQMVRCLARQKQKAYHFQLLTS